MGMNSSRGAECGTKGAAGCGDGHRRLCAVAVVAWGCVLAVFVGLTLRRNLDYRSEEELWRDVIRKRPANARAWQNLGSELARQGRRTEALGVYEEAVRLDPRDPWAQFGLGTCLVNEGQIERGIEHLRIVSGLGAPPALEADAQLNAGCALHALGRTNEAWTAWRAALALRPDYAGTLYEIGRAHDDAGQTTDAERLYRRAVAADPGRAEAWNRLGVLLLSGGGRQEEGIACLERAVIERPEMFEAHFNLGCALLRAGRMDEATGAFETAVRIEPTHKRAALLLERAHLQATQDVAEGQTEVRL